MKRKVKWSIADENQSKETRILQKILNHEYEWAAGTWKIPWPCWLLRLHSTTEKPDWKYPIVQYSKP